MRFLDRYFGKYAFWDRYFGKYAFWDRYFGKYAFWDRYFGKYAFWRKWRGLPEPSVINSLVARESLRILSKNLEESLRDFHLQQKKSIFRGASCCINDT